MILMGAGGQAQGSRRKAPSPGDGRSGRNSGAPAIGAIDLLEEVEPGNKKGVAPKRLRCCVFGVVKPHGRQNSPRWLTSGCERGPPASPITIPPSLESLPVVWVRCDGHRTTSPTEMVELAPMPAAILPAGACRRLGR